jgi:hypothetical protein
VSDALRQVDELDADADDLTQDQMEDDYGYYVALDLADWVGSRDD